MQNELCHYCDLPAFKSIIEKREIWLSDIHFLNDSSEESLFLDALTDLMIKLRDSLSDSTKAYLDQDTFMNSFFTNIKYNYKNKLYICCFTNEKNDDLSQWRGYADDGAGFCIGFKKELINKLSENTTIEKHTLKDDGSLQKERISTSYVFSQKDITYSDKKDRKTGIVKSFSFNEQTVIAVFVKQHNTVIGFLIFVHKVLGCSYSFMFLIRI